MVGDLEKLSSGWPLILAIYEPKMVIIPWCVGFIANFFSAITHDRKYALYARGHKVCRIAQTRFSIRVRVGNQGKTVRNAVTLSC